MKLQDIKIGMRVVGYNNGSRFNGEVSEIGTDGLVLVGSNEICSIWIHPKQLRKLVPKKNSADHQKMIFHRIEPGKFLMGDEKIETEITQPFELMSTPLTQGQWCEVADHNPSHFPGVDLPVERVSWENVQEFIVRLNNLSSGDLIKRIIPDHKPGMVYRLPTEAEWEYVAQRAEDYQKNLDDHAWYWENSDSTTHPVRQKKPHLLAGHDFYDLFGNVWEWCSDWYGALSGGKDPKGPELGSFRVVRGGGWDDGARYCRSAYRNYCSPGARYNFVGFRLCRSGTEPVSLGPSNTFTSAKKKARKEIRRWVNVHRDGNHYTYVTKGDADRATDFYENRIACVELKGFYEIEE